MAQQHDVVVIGGGLAGLAAAATAARDGRSVLVVDGPGGNRATTDRVGRFLFNRGAHALYRSGRGSAVLDRLGVARAGGRPPRTLVARRGERVGLAPTGVLSLARTRLVSPAGKVRLGRVVAGARRWRPDELADRTAAAWFDELGLRGDERAAVETLARTTSYIADLEVVSADLVAQQLLLALDGGVDYLHGGWQTLLDGLAGAGRAAGVTHRRARVAAVAPDGRGVRVELAGAGDGEAVVAGAAVVAAGTPDACAAVLPDRPAAWRALGPPVRVACLDLGLAAWPRRARPVLLGVDRPIYLIRHDPPAALSPARGAVVHAMCYLRADDDRPAAEVRAELEAHCRLAGIDPAGAEEVRFLHRMAACGALPLPATGGLRGRPGVDSTGLPGVFVAGDWVGPDGHLADAALTSGEAAGRAAAGHAAAVERSAGGEARLAAHG
ncbi:MAG: FAD-dependent oxidoreductase [Acidimicrobiia bacterium]